MTDYYRKKGSTTITDELGNVTTDPGVLGSIGDIGNLPLFEDRPGLGGQGNTSNTGTPPVNRYGDAVDSYLGQFSPSTPESEQGIRDQKRDEVQSYIDTIDETYAGITQRAEEVGRDQLGRTRARGARGGILGSSFGDANLQKTEKVTSENIKAIQDEKNQRIAAVMLRADERADKEIQFKRNESLAGQEAKLGYLKEVRDEARNDIREIANSGVSLSKLKSNPEYYNQFIEETGWSEVQFDAVYNNNLPKEAQIDYKYQIIDTADGKKILAYGMDPSNGEISSKEYDVDFELPAGDWKFMIAPNGSPIQYNEDGDIKILPGDFSKPDNGEEDDLTPTEELNRAKGDMKDQLMGARGTDGYISPMDYKKARTAWHSEGYDKRIFDDTFDLFINPAHPEDYDIE